MECFRTTKSATLTQLYLPTVKTIFSWSQTNIIGTWPSSHPKFTLSTKILKILRFSCSLLHRQDALALSTTFSSHGLARNVFWLFKSGSVKSLFVKLAIHRITGVHTAFHVVWYRRLTTTSLITTIGVATCWAHLSATSSWIAFNGGYLE